MSRAIATAHWRRLTGEGGTDRCTLSQVDQGWLLSGQAIWRENGADCALGYVVRCGPDWLSQSAEIVGSGPRGEVGLVLTRATEGWRLNGQLQPGTAGCLDLDFGFTPATNLMPLRRLRGAGPLAVVAAWLPDDHSALRPLEQSYRRSEAGEVLYASPGFKAALIVDESGFVARYPGLWEGWVDAG